MSPQTDLDSSILGRGMIGFVRKLSRSFVKKTASVYLCIVAWSFFMNRGASNNFNIDENIYSSVLFYTFLL